MTCINFAVTDALSISTSSSVFEVRVFLLLLLCVIVIVFKCNPIVMLFVLGTLSGLNSMRDGVMSLEYSAVSNEVIL
jgi:hypothetical protein